MKKLISVLVTAVLLLATCAALGEEIQLNENASSFDIFLTLPEGVTLSQEASTLGVKGSLAVAAMPDLKVSFSLVPDDLYADMDLQHLTEDDLKHIFKEISMDLGETTYEIKNTSKEVPLMTILDASRTEMMNLLLVDGHFLYVAACSADHSALSDDAVALLVKILDTVSIPGCEHTTKVAE